MFKKYLILLFCAVCTIQAWDDRDEVIEISPLTNQVHQRFYFIARLEKTIQELFHLHTDHHLHLPHATISFFKTVPGFENMHILECVKGIIKEKNLSPLFACWQTIVTYKYIDDDELTNEFSQLIYLILQQLIIAKKINTQTLESLSNREIINPESITHQVSFRFYLLKRLTKTRENRSLIEQPIVLPEYLHFAHEKTFNCYQKILETQSIKPLLDLFEIIEQYRYINNSSFIQEFLQLIFVTEVCIREQNSDLPIDPHSFEHIASLTATELLEAIDIELSKQDQNKREAYILLEENFDFSPNHFAHYVYRRFYFIQRLERIISLFKEVERNLKSDLFDFDESFAFKHTRIQESIRTMQREHSLKPLFAVWDDFVTYKSIEDQLFVEEFTKEIFVLSRNMLLCTGVCARHLPQLRTTIGLPAQKLLDIIDLYLEQFMEHTATETPYHLQTTITPLRVPDLQTNVHINDVILRFYHIQRLGIIFWLLNEIQEKSIPVKLTYSKTLHGVLIDSKYEFTHEHIVSMIKIIEQTDSIEPLMGLLQGIQHYKYIDDQIFTREYLLLTLITLQHLKINYRNIHLPILSNSDNRTSNDDSIPLDRILDALDLLAKELPELLEKYELQGTLPWTDWFKKYWWMPAIIGGGLALKIYLTLHHPQLLTNNPKSSDTKPMHHTTPVPRISSRPKPKLTKPPANNSDSE